MKFVITQGCTAFNFTVDDKRFDDLPREEKEKVIDHVLSKVKEQVLNNHIGFQGILEHFQYDSYDVGPKCDSCGDSVVTTVINI
jgi:hypothetical protein